MKILLKSIKCIQSYSLLENKIYKKKLMIIIKLIKQLNLIRIILLSVIFLNSQISFAQDSNKWIEGTYLGTSLILNTIEHGNAHYKNGSSSDVIEYNSDNEISKGIKIGHTKLLTNNIFAGPEFFYSKEKSLDFNDEDIGGVTDTIRFLENYNIGLRGGYIINKDIALVLGVGFSYQEVETSYVSSGVDDDQQLNTLHGEYRNLGLLFNLGNSYNLEISHQINSFDDSISKDAASGRIAHTINIDKIKSKSITISKVF